MMRYSVQLGDQIFVKRYEFLSFAKNMSKNIGKNISKNLKCKYSHTFLDHVKKSATDTLKTASKRAIQKATAEIGNLIGSNTADRIIKVSKTSQRNNSEMSRS